MTKKDYIKIAELLKSEKPEVPENRTTDTWKNGALDEWSTITLNMTKLLQSDNPRFDKIRFLNACGYQEFIK